MAGAGAAYAFARCFILSQRSASISSSSYIRHLLFVSSSSSSSYRFSTTFPSSPRPDENPIINFRRPFSSSNSKLVNFSPSDSDSDNDNTKLSPTPRPKELLLDKTKLPPPYDPFSKKPAFEEPDDPNNLPEVFHKMSSEEGLFNNAVKMFDALSKDGLTHEALELFSQIKDKGHMPDVVSHTAVLEAYANAGQAKEANRTYLRMLASGVAPNAYTYSVLIKSLSGSGDKKLMREAKKYMKEMMGKGMKPNAGTWVAVFETFAREEEEEKVEEGRELLEEMKAAAGFKPPDENAVREVLREKRGPVPRKVMEMLFAG